MKWSLTLVAG